MVRENMEKFTVPVGTKRNATGDGAFPRGHKMIHQKCQGALLSVLMAALLSACGGGSAGGTSSGTQDTPATPSGPTLLSSTVPSPKAGDYYTYRSTASKKDLLDGSTSTILGPEYYLYTSYFTDSGPNAIQITQRGSPYFHTGKQLVFSGAGVVSSDETLIGCGYTYTPAWNEIPATVTVGTAWETTVTVNNAHVFTCNDTTMPGQLTTKGTAVSSESIQVAAGSFNTIKVNFQTTLKKSDGTITRSGTCWRDVVSGMNVKCSIDTTVPPGTTGDVNGSVTDELVGYSTAATGKRKVGTERFAGSWTDEYTSDEPVSCRIFIDATGTMSGSCSSRSFPEVDLPVNGRVDAAGNVDFTVKSSFGPTYITHYKGTATDTATMTGTSDFLPDHSGRWKLVHY